MAKQLNASMPPDLDLGPNYIVRVNVIDPTDGSQVTGVTVSDFSILCTNLTGGDLDSGAFTVVGVRQQS